jgi:hypothetical protein
VLNGKKQNETKNCQLMVVVSETKLFFIPRLDMYDMMTFDFLEELTFWKLKLIESCEILPSTNFN